MTCLLPVFLTIMSLNPCATWSHAQASFEEARRRVWWVSVTLDPIYGNAGTWSDPRMEELAGWKLIEYEGTGFVRGGANLAGLIDSETRTIEFAKDSNLWPLAHEFAHWIHLVHPWPYGVFWQFTGHGGLLGVGSLDIFTHTLWTQLCGVLFRPYCEIPEAHQYSPQWMLDRRMPTVDWCKVDSELMELQ